MPANMNLIKLNRTLEAIKSEVQVRIDRSLDDDGEPNTEAFSVMNPDISKSMGDYLTEKAEEMARVQKEINDYNKATGAMDTIDSLIALGKEKATHTPLPVGKARESIYEAFTKSETYDHIAAKRQDKGSFDSELSLKELFASDSNVADNVNVESIRTGDFVMLPRTRVTILDIIPQIMTTEHTIKYDREIKNLSNMAPIAQGGIYQESEFTIEEDTANVVKIGSFIQVSEELLEDRPEIRARMNGSLGMQMMRRLQSDVVGSTTPLPAAEYVGTPTNNASTTGILEETSINTMDGNAGAGSGNYHNPVTLIQEAIELCYRVGEADASAILMNSQDWVMVATQQSTTGAFIARGALLGIAPPTMQEVEGLPVVLCNALPNNTVIVGDFANHSVIRDRQSVQVRMQEAQGFQVSALNTDVMTSPSGRYNIYADARAAFYVRRPQAFTSITNYGVPLP